MLIPPRRRRTQELLFEPRTIAEQEAILSLTKDYLLLGAAPVHISRQGVED